MGGGEDPHKNPGALGLVAASILGWLALASTAANIMAMTFCCEAALVLHGTIGALGLGWYYLPFAILWRNINPLTPLYTHSGLWGRLATCRPIVHRPPACGADRPHAG